MLGHCSNAIYAYGVVIYITLFCWEELLYSLAQALNASLKPNIALVNDSAK